MAKESETSALDIACLLLSNNEIEYTPLKLQKILYYCYAYHLCITGKELFKEKVLAWQWGPVVKEVYDQYKKYGGATIDACEKADDDINLSAESLSVISSVLDAYGSFSGSGLMQRTHTEKPWIEAYEQGKGTEINKDTIKNFYSAFVS